MRRVVFHTGKASGQEPYQAALDIYRQVSSEPDKAVEDLIALLEGKAFSWGVSDGN